MQYVVPDYYKEFKCIAGDCRHSCCIGWEIDIDEKSLGFFQSVTGEFGDRLRNNISCEGEPHFILGENERCPFLNDKNLCDIILTLGEEHICGICTDHPRFSNELPGRVETGLGLCCEEAGRIILGKKEPVKLIVTGEKEADDEIISLRDELIELMHLRDLTIDERINAMLEKCGTPFPEYDLTQWADLLLDLERMDEKWTRCLQLLKGEIDFDGFAQHMAQRQTEYEQFVVYLLYRHFANASDEWDAAARVGFAAFGYLILSSMGAALWTKTGEFHFEDQVELARLFSAEIEYSDDNRFCILDMFC